MFHNYNMFVDSYIASLVVSILCSLDDHTKLYILLMKKKRILSRFSLKYWQWVKVVFHASTLALYEYIS